ncbi:Hpt domain-containing protein [Sphingomonas sp.]|jgi:hypothetical protein|uniref:Hpt domain-containing protein n=1 Tax=Sphingomonas sp. TaxID=28214 RepID=UPI002ED9A232
MAYDPGAIDAALSAAVGEDAALIAELRTALAESVARALLSMRQARDEEAWRTAAGRLRGLAASFGAVRLMALAASACDGAAGDAEMLRKLERAAARL